MPALKLPIDDTEVNPFVHETCKEAMKLPKVTYSKREGIIGLQAHRSKAHLDGAQRPLNGNVSWNRYTDTHGMMFKHLLIHSRDVGGESHGNCISVSLSKNQLAEIIPLEELVDIMQIALRKKGGKP